jgi:hypothetical protein
MAKNSWWKEKTSGSVNIRGYAALLPFVTASVTLVGVAILAAH